MKKINISEALDKVSAPPNFEAKLMEKLTFYKEKRKKRIKYLRFSFAIACTLLIIFVSVYFWNIKDKEFDTLTTLNTPINNNSISIIERIDYSGEFVKTSQNKETIFILEQISSKEEIYFWRR